LKDLPTPKATSHDGITRVLAAHGIAKNGLPSLFALFPAAPNQLAVAARGIFKHGAENQTEDTDEIKGCFPSRSTTLLLLCIPFLIAVAIEESCFSVTASRND
jgi:hypothetical protein